MEIFGMGPLELLLIMVIALIVFGPGKLPEIAAGLGKGIRDFRNAASNMTKEVMDEFDASREKTERPGPSVSPVSKETYDKRD